MKILIMGAGLSGCSIARLLKDRGHTVSLIEKEGRVGGLCITKVNEDGIKYEPFGARTFHSKNPRIKAFITKFDKFNGYIHKKGMIINGKLFPFPITKEAINNFEERGEILRELKKRPNKIDRTNFETASISIFGKTLYEYFIKNYTTKMWGMDPENLTAEWASKRLKLSEDNREGAFKDEWQGLPIHGYSFLLSKIIENIQVALNTSEFRPNDNDIVISSGPIDKFMKFKFGKLQYRSLRFYYKKNEEWENEDYGTINLPQHPRYIRKCNFKILHKQKSRHNLIQYQQSIAADKNNIPMYPINTEKSNKIFDKYLKEICKSKNICPIGRLGLFKYLNMDSAIEVAFEMAPIVEDYLDLRPIDRYEKIKNIIEKH